jgi:hypothetical protein
MDTDHVYHGEHSAPFGTETHRVRGRRGAAAARRECCIILTGESAKSQGNAQPAGLSRRTRKELISMALASGYQKSDLDGLTVPQLRLLLVGWDPASVPRSQPSASSAAASAAQGAERPTGADRATPPECTCNRRATVLKKNASKFGDRAWFWSCQEWPRCRQTYQYQVPRDEEA